MPDRFGRNKESARPDDDAAASSPAEAVEARSRFPNADPELVYDLSRRKLDLQMQQAEALDNKAVSTFQAGAVLLGLVGAMFAVWDVSVPDSALVLLYFGTGSFVVLVLLFVLVYVTNRWGVGPNIDEAWEYSENFDKDTMYWWAAESFSQQAEANSERMKLKVLGTKLLLFFFRAEAVGLLLGLIVLGFTRVSE